MQLVAKIVGVLFVCCTVSATIVGAGDSSEASPPDIEPSSSSAEIQLVISLVWEGQNLLAHNLEALRTVRAEYPDIPFVHLISPAYMTRSEATADRHGELIRSLIKPQDKLGLLLTAWRSQVLQAGGIFRSGPTLWGHELDDSQCSPDCGVDVPVTIYPKDEITKLMIHGKVVLENAGIKPVTGFGSQAHLADQNMFNIARSLNFDHDFSAVAPEILAPRIKHFPYYQWVRGLWSDIKTDTQPYVISTPAGALVTVPLTGGSLDYEDLGTIMKRFTAATKAVGNAPPSLARQVFHIQFHQETAERYAPNLSRLLKMMYAQTAKSGTRMMPTVFQKTAISPNTANQPEPPEKEKVSRDDEYPREALAH